jgi:hypothetical protein
VLLFRSLSDRVLLLLLLRMLWLDEEEEEEGVLAGVVPGVF